MKRLAWLLCSLIAINTTSCDFFAYETDFTFKNASDERVHVLLYSLEIKQNQKTDNHVFRQSALKLAFDNGNIEAVDPGGATELKIWMQPEKGSLSENVHFLVVISDEVMTTHTLYNIWEEHMYIDARVLTTQSLERLNYSITYGDEQDWTELYNLL